MPSNGISRTIRSKNKSSIWCAFGLLFFQQNWFFVALRSSKWRRRDENRNFISTNLYYFIVCLHLNLCSVAFILSLLFFSFIYYFFWWPRNNSLSLNETIVIHGKTHAMRWFFCSFKRFLMKINERRPSLTHSLLLLLTLMNVMRYVINFSLCICSLVWINNASCGCS